MNKNLSDNQYKELDERRENHLKGISKSYAWNEVKENARQAKLKSK